ncbi:hypothetical protein [Clostridium felsineum]|uniref:Uncharacterized protein n=2 Tax=Clostridium felsineum TaxID=36839 RepID=A0A1S8KYQ8_9CLOT|nr:hypothetical protein [Clostridium felsineum]URZ03863.1 hypothetical protein CLAUR_039290 [Clostridium felsineum]URZ07861.1 hypothetical protein CLROS_032220 [Clostridium felsineum]URZ12892.1 hypothetical protein CROST_036370 [Clostridium felsineum]
MDISQILQTMQTSSAQKISGTNNNSSGDSALFNMIMKEALEKQNGSASKSSTSSTQKAGAKNDVSAAKELELMLQLQALQSMSSSYSSIDSAGDSSSSNNSSLSSGNNYAYQILSSLSNPDGNKIASSTSNENASNLSGISSLF